MMCWLFNSVVSYRYFNCAKNTGVCPFSKGFSESKFSVTGASLHRELCCSGLHLSVLFCAFGWERVADTLVFFAFSLLDPGAGYAGTQEWMWSFPSVLLMLAAPVFSALPVGL